MKFIDRFVDSVVSHYRLTMVIILLITGVMSYFYFQQKQENSIEKFFFKDDPILQQYQQIRDKIGSDELAVIAFQKENLFTSENIQIIRDLTQALQKIDGIMRVHSLTEIDELEITDDEINVNKLIPDGDLSDAQLIEIQQKISGLKGYNHLAAKTGNSTTTIIIAELEQVSSAERTAICNDILHITQEITKDRAKLHHTGIPIILTEMDKMTKKDLHTLTPLVGLVIFVIILMLFRNITLSIIAMFTLAMTQGWGIGLFVMCGERFSFPTAALAPILVALAIADSVHLISHFIDTYHNDKELEYEDKVARVTKAVWIPCLFTTLTTAIGFFSFVTSPLQPVFVLGIFAAVGVLFAFVIDVTFIPSALIIAQPFLVIEDIGRSFLKGAVNGKPRNRIFSNVLDKIGRFSTTHVVGLVFTFAVIITLVIIGMTKLRFESNPLKHLADSNKIKADLVFIENHFGGVTPSLMVIKSKKDLDFTSPEALRRIETIQKGMSEKYGKYIHTTYSVVDFIKEANKAFNHNDNNYYTIPENRSDVLDYYEMNTHPEVLKRMISRDRREAYVTSLAVVNNGTTEEWQSMIDDKEMDKYLDELLGEDFSYSLTGLSQLIVKMQENLKLSQVQSIIAAFFLISIMMFFVCKNVKFALIGMIPNIFPIITTLGIMGWLDIPLNEATIMIAAVTLGIAVDDTVHFIVWYRRGMDSGMTTVEALRNTFKIVGKPIVVTTILLSLGFFVMIFGSFKPTQTYGVLTAFSMIMALVGDFFLLPGLILMFKPKVAQEADAEEATVGCYVSSYQCAVGYAETVSHSDN